MTDELKSCIVSPPRACNHATTVPPNETGGETSTQPTDLLALAQRVLDKNKCNNSRNNPATDQLQGANASQQKELRKLICIVSQHYGGDDNTFLNNYIDEVIATNRHNLSVAITCFKELASQHFPVNNRK